MPRYSSGTITVTGTTVQGANTAWDSEILVAGDILEVPLATAHIRLEVASVDYVAQTAVLEMAYAGPAISGAAYFVSPENAVQAIKTVAGRMTGLAGRYDNLSGLIDASGNIIVGDQFDLIQEAAGNADRAEVAALAALLADIQDTKADATTALGGYSEGDVILVNTDETNDGAPMLYRVVSGALVEGYSPANSAQVAAVDAKVDAGPLPVLDATALAALDYDGAAVGRVITMLDTGTQYEVVADNAATFDYQPGILRLLRKGGVDGPVRPEQFGWTSGGGNQNDAMLAVAEYGRRTGDLELVGDGGTYSYVQNTAFSGVEKRLVFRNMGLQCLHVSVNGDVGFAKTKQAFVLEDCWQITDNAGYVNNVFSQPRSGVSLTASVSPGDTEITVADGSEFVAGKSLLLYGFATQTSAYPNACREHQYISIERVVGNTIYLSSPVLSEYRTDWPDFQSNVNAPLWGAARAISLHRPGEFVETEILEFHNVRFVDDPAFVDAIRSGRPWFAGYQSCLLNKCAGVTGAYVLQGKTFRATGTSFGGDVENDKFIDSATFNGSTLKSISQGTGVKRLRYEDTDVGEILNVAAMDEITLDGGRYGAFSGGGNAIPDTFGCGGFNFRSGVIALADGTTSVLGHTDFSETFTYGGTINGNDRLSISEADFRANDMRRALRANSVLYDKNGVPAFQLLRLPYLSGGNMIFEGRNLDGQSPATRELFAFGTTRMDIAGASYEGGAQYLNPVQAGTFGANHCKVKSKNIDNGVISLSSDYVDGMPTTTTNFELGEAIAIDEIVIDVQKAYTGSTSNASMRIEALRSLDSTSPDFAVIRLTETGKRVINLSGEYGAQTGDTLNSLLANPLLTEPTNRVSVRSGGGVVDHSAATDKAVWTIQIRGTPRRV